MSVLCCAAPFQDGLKDLLPEAVIEYAEKHGWRFHHHYTDDAAWYTNETAPDDPFLSRILILKRKEYGDYRRRMLECIYAFSKHEDRCAKAIFDEIVSMSLGIKTWDDAMSAMSREELIEALRKVCIERDSLQGQLKIRNRHNDELEKALEERV